MSFHDIYIYIYIYIYIDRQIDRQIDMYIQTHFKLKKIKSPGTYPT